MLKLHVAPCSPDRSRLPASRDAAGQSARARVPGGWGLCPLPRPPRGAMPQGGPLVIRPDAGHVHLTLVLATADGLARTIGETHRQYTGFVNARARWTGHLFQGRFAS